MGGDSTSQAKQTTESKVFKVTLHSDSKDRQWVLVAELQSIGCGEKKHDKR